MAGAGFATAFESGVLTIEGTTDQLSSVATENSGLAPAWRRRLQTALSSYFGMDGGIQAGGAGVGGGELGDGGESDEVI